MKKLILIIIIGLFYFPKLLVGKDILGHNSLDEKLVKYNSNIKIANEASKKNDKELALSKLIESKILLEELNKDDDLKKRIGSMAHYRKLLEINNFYPVNKIDSKGDEAIKLFEDNVKDKFNFIKTEESKLLKLPELSQEEEEAGVREEELYYDPQVTKFMRLGKYHVFGNSFGYQLLAYIFFGTIFQFYTDKLLGLNLNFDYENLIKKLNSGTELSNDERQKIKEIVSKFNLSENIKSKNDIDKLANIIQDFKIAAENLKRNVILLKLGVAYQRMKIVVEKIGEFPGQVDGQIEFLSSGRASNNNSTLKKYNINFSEYQKIIHSNSPKQKKEFFENLKNKMQKDLSEIRKREDKLTTDIQTMIYNFMKEAYGQFLKKYKTSSDHKGVSEFLINFKPDFLNSAYYKKIIDQLDLLIKPIEKIDNFIINERIEVRSHEFYKILNELFNEDSSKKHWLMAYKID